MSCIDTETAYNTYKTTIKNCMTSEYANWVVAVQKALAGNKNALTGFPQWVTEVYELAQTEAVTKTSDCIR